MEVSTFICSICSEVSQDICVYCTKDACSNHLCERCHRCSDCCGCEMRLSQEESIPVAHNGHAIPKAESPSERPLESTAENDGPEMLGLAGT